MPLRASRARAARLQGLEAASLPNQKIHRNADADYFLTVRQPPKQVLSARRLGKPPKRRDLDDLADSDLNDDEHTSVRSRTHVGSIAALNNSEADAPKGVSVQTNALERVDTAQHGACGLHQKLLQIGHFSI
jgi:hypothetical protein